MTKKCRSCASKDPEFQRLVAIQTISFLCCQTMVVTPYAGMHAHFMRGRSSWWSLFALQNSLKDHNLVPGEFKNEATL